MLRVGILGAGGIAQKMAATLNGMESAQAWAIAARDGERARKFAQEWGFEKSYGSYEALLADPDVDLVYIATPHSHHYRCVKMSLEAGKHVLCEKSFTVNARQAEDLFELAKQKNLLLTEAIWTRYMPSRKMIDDLIAGGAIGTPVCLMANLGYELHDVARIWDRNLAGGALLDLGVYVINFARMVFGENMTDIKAQAAFRSGVDMTDSITMIFDGDKVATTQVCAMAAQNRTGMIFGTEGYIEVTNINNPERIRVFDADYQEKAVYDPPKQITGYEYEVEACARAIAEGALECPEMPHAETIRIMEIMDGIRESWGYEIPLLD